MNNETGRLSRRDLIVGLAGSMALSACGGSSSSGVSILSSGLTTLGTQVPDDSTTEIATWTNLKGTQFGAGAFGLKLVDIEAQPVVGDRPAQLRRQPFIATFDVIQGGVMPPDQTYTITSATVNPFAIFLAGNTADPARMYALFN